MSKNQPMMEVKRFPGGLELHEERAIDRIARTFVVSDNQSKKKSHGGKSFADALSNVGLSSMFPWKGYAGFRFAGKNNQGKDYQGEYDLVLITHHNILVIELKDWYGTVTSDGSKWFQNDNERENAFHVTRRKKEFLESKLKKLNKKKFSFLRDNEKNRLRVEFFVVFTKDTDFSHLPEEEKQKCLSFEQFLSIKTETGFKKLFPRFHSAAVGLNKDLAVFDDLFSEKYVKPKKIVKNGFVKSELLFPVTEKKAKESVYAEYIAEDARTGKQKALMRHWNFNNFEDFHMHTNESRLKVISHEHDVLADIASKDFELYESCLHPKTSPQQIDMNEEVYELFDLPLDKEQFNSFIDKYVQSDKKENDKLDLIEVIVHKFSQLHKISIAHRDIGSHSLWLNHGHKVTLSSFVTAYYQQVGTVGDVRSTLSMSEIEDSGIEGGAKLSRLSAFQADVYALAVIAHLIMNGERASQHSLSSAYSNIQKGSGWLYEVLKTAISPEFDVRFSTATEFLEELQKNRPVEPAEIKISSTELNPFRTQFNPYVEYTPECMLETSSPSVQAYLSGNSFVKVWNGVNPSDESPSSIIKARQFCELADLLRNKHLAFIPNILGFGISQVTSQLYLVQDKVEGVLLKECDLSAYSEDQRIGYASALVDAVSELHEYGYSHGDLHPGNLFVVESGDALKPVIIDFPNYFFGASPDHNHEYSPPNVGNIPDYELDAWAVGSIVAEILDIQEVVEYEPGSELEQLRRLIFQERFKEDSLVGLDLIKECFSRVTTESIKEINVGYWKVEESEATVYPDNGHVFISVEPAKQNKSEVLVALSGIGNALKVFYDPYERKISSILGVFDQESVLPKVKSDAAFAVPLKLNIVKVETNAVENLTYYLNELDTFSAYCKEVLESRESDSDKNTPEDVIDDGVISGKTAPIDSVLELPNDSNDIEPKNRVSIGTKELWKAILVAESNIQPTAFVRDINDWSESSSKRRIVYSSDSNFMESWKSDERVEAFKVAEGEEYYIGDVDLHTTLTNRRNLKDAFILNPAKRFRLERGDEIRLVSTSTKSSLKRRKKATDNIISGKSEVPDLINVFESLSSDQVKKYAEIVPSSDIASFADSLGTTLNNSQINAIQKTLTYGPVALVQGPPGTGKTHFIGSLIAFLFERFGAQNVLLTSQSHEAVNNAVEKVAKVNQSIENDISIVRFSNKASNVSDEIQDVFSPNIISSSVESFKAQFSKRLLAMKRVLGINEAFLIEMVTFSESQRRFESTKKALESQDDIESEAPQNTRLEELEESFIRTIESRFGVVIDEDYEISVRNELCARYGVSEAEALKVDSLLKLSFDYIDRLETSQLSYESFLAKTRHLVCGTCVGLGKPSLEVQKVSYDWVIIDEAARSTASELAIAMQSGKRVLLVGDHKQLPPLYDRELEKELSKSLGVRNRDVIKKELISDFQKVFESSYGDQVSVSLIEQYRMLPSIGDLVSSVFYDELISARKAPLIDHSKYSLPHALRRDFCWLDTSSYGMKSYHDESLKSPMNEVEVGLILDLLSELLENDEYLTDLSDAAGHAEPIGIICMYAAQRDLILRTASERGLSEAIEGRVKIDTVDSYQGKENALIIISLSLNSKELNPRFLKEANRINVAISRAMDKVVIVGATRMWKGRNENYPLGKVVSYLEQRKDDSRFLIIDAKSGEESQ